MAEEMRQGERRGVSRRALLIGGGAGLGLFVAWAVWPRSYLPNLMAGPGESLFGAWLKIGADGQVTVAVPQAELGQGVFTALPQILADELGADWRTVGVEAAPLNPLYANPLGAATLFEVALGALPEQLRRTHAARTALVVTGGSSSVRQFEDALRDAGAAARVMLCKAAAAQWNVDWRACATADGFVVAGEKRARFGELAAAAADQSVPETLPMRGREASKLYGQGVPRLDVPGKVDGSAQFAGDIRLPDMVYAAIRMGPTGNLGLGSKADDAAANRVPGMLAIVRSERWIAAAAQNWWAAERALDAIRPHFKIAGEPINTGSIEAALATALGGEGTRIAAQGDLAATFRGARVVSADYRVGLAVHAALEPMTATASFAGGRAEVWAPAQAPGLMRAAIARACGLAEDAVTVHVMMAGGSFGAKLEHEVAVQAALVARQIGRPVQLVWSRGEDLRHDRYRPAAAARMTGRLGDKGAIAGWLAKIAAPATGLEVTQRLFPGDAVVSASLALHGRDDAAAVAGAIPPYAIGAWAVDHHRADIGVPTGHWRSDAHSYTCFFNESFIDELAHVADSDALSFRMPLLTENPRLARCLQIASELGGWKGSPGSGHGLACHAFRDSYIAVFAEARLVPGRKVKVERLVAAVDAGRIANPDLVHQQIEGGLIFGMAAALGASTGFTENVADAARLGDLALPTLADTPDITVELIRSESDPGGVGELAVPPVAPAIANALQSATGVRFRQLPLLSDVE